MKYIFWYYTIQYCVTQYNTMQNATWQCNGIQYEYDMIGYNMKQYKIYNAVN